MADVLVRGLSEEGVRTLDARARSKGLSRNEYLRQHLEHVARREGETTVADLAWITDAYAELRDDAVRDALWR